MRAAIQQGDTPVAGDIPIQVHFPMPDAVTGVLPVCYGKVTLPAGVELRPDTRYIITTSQGHRLAVYLAKEIGGDCYFIGWGEPP